MFLKIFAFNKKWLNETEDNNEEISSQLRDTVSLKIDFTACVFTAFTDTTHQRWVQEEHLRIIYLFFVNEKSTVTDDKENQVHFLKPDWLCDSHEIKDFSDEHNHIPISWTDFTNRQYYFIPMIDLLMSKKMVTRVKTVADTSVREIPSWEMFNKSSCSFYLFLKIQIFLNAQGLDL